jgi:hypothetical protein
MTEFSVEYHCGWISEGSVPVPAASLPQIAREDAEAKREAEREAARAEDLAEARALMARTTGRVKHGLAGVFAAAERRMAAQDYTTEREELQRNATEWTGEPPPRPRLWTDERLAAEAGQVQLRRMRDQAAAEHIASEKLILEAQERHPVTSRWPAWIRRS